MLRGCIATTSVKIITSVIIHLIILIICRILRYLSENLAAGWEPVQSTVWLLTVIFIGGSGVEGSTWRNRKKHLNMEKTLSYHRDAEDLVLVIDRMLIRVT